jgi:hypothetical protein
MIFRRRNAYTENRCVKQELESIFDQFTIFHRIFWEIWVYTEHIYYLYSSQIVFRFIKSRSTRRARHASRMERWRTRAVFLTGRSQDRKKDEGLDERLLNYVLKNRMWGCALISVGSWLAQNTKSFSDSVSGCKCLDHPTFIKASHEILRIWWQVVSYISV